MYPIMNIAGFIVLAVLAVFMWREKLPLLGMAALEVVSGAKALVGAAYEDLVATNNTTFSVRTFPDKLPDGTPVKAHLIHEWERDDLHAGFFKTKSALMHDNTDGIQTSVQLGIVTTSVPTLISPQRLYPNDKLSLQAKGTAADVVTKSLLAYYEYLPGVDARFIDNQGLRDRGWDLMAVQLLITPTTSVDFSGQRTIIADFDQVKAGEDYAVLGAYNSSGMCTTIRITAGEFGNLGVGIPGAVAAGQFNNNTLAHWFPYLSQRMGVALIPVFNGSNKTNVLVDVLSGATAAPTCQLTIFLMRLRGNVA